MFNITKIKYTFYNFELSFNYVFIFLFSCLFSSSLLADEGCKLTDLSTNNATHLQKNIPSTIKVQPGVNQFQLNCSLSESSIFSFTRAGLLSATWLQDGQSKLPIKTNQVAYFIGPGDIKSSLTLFTKSSYTPRFTLVDTPQFIANKELYTLIFGLFYGLCFTLIFYVLIIGKGLKDSVFILYGFYIACLGSFIFFQEGHAYLFIDSHFSLYATQLYQITIGLTVISATWFISELLLFKRDWPKLSVLLKLAACFVFILCLDKVAFNLQDYSQLASVIKGYLSLLIVFSVFVLCAIQTKNNINEAKLVLIALCCVLISMTFRIVLTEYSPFIQRYGFVIAFTLESLLLAVAISKRLQRLANEKAQAEKHAHYDSLCDIYNRRGWSLKANNLLYEQSYKGGYLCFLYIDLDDFKAVNDTYGHDVGDRVLFKVATLLNNFMNNDEAVGRLGGDEFVVLSLFKSQSAMQQKINDLKNEFNTLTLKFNQVVIPIKGSIGQVVFSKPPNSIDEILKAGDSAMYNQKSFRKAAN